MLPGSRSEKEIEIKINPGANRDFFIYWVLSKKRQDTSF